MYLTQWFEPEPNIVKGLAFVRALEAAGHEVTVVTGLPNYPTGRIYPGYRLRPIQHETIEGVRIVRLPLYASHDDSSLRRSLNFLSFFLSALLYCLVRGGRYDLAYAYHPPITIGLAAALGGRLRGLRFVLEVQDLWPDTIVATGMRGAERLVPLLGALCRFVYARASAIIAQSDGMRRALIERGVPAAEITTIRNWADAEFFPPPATTPAADRPFTAVYGGNLGRAQALETVVDAAALLETAASIHLYGDGIEAAALHARGAGIAGLHFEGRLPQDRIIAIFAAADALILHLRDDPLFTVTIPSKTQFYLAMGRPIIAGVSGEAANILRESGAAIVVPPGNAPALARAIEQLAAMPQAQRDAMGEAGRRYYHDNLSFDRGMVRTLQVIAGTNLGKTRNHPAEAR